MRKIGRICWAVFSLVLWVPSLVIACGTTPPVAVLQNVSSGCSENKVTVNTSVTFDGCSSSASSPKTIVTYRWYFDYVNNPNAYVDTTAPTRTKANTYTTVGVYTVALKVQDSGGAWSSVTTINITVCGTCTPSLTTTVLPSGAGSITPNPSGPYSCGQQVQLTANPAAGYHFVNWSGDASGTTSPVTITMSGDKSVTANFSMDTPVITVPPVSQSVNEGGTATFSVTATGVGLTYQWQKNQVDIPGATASSYTTPTLVMTDNGNGYRCIVTNTGGSATSIEATLAVIQNTYTLTANPNDPTYGSVTKNPDNTSYTSGQLVALAAVPASGHHFVNWTGDTSGISDINPNITVTMTGNKTLTANFELGLTLTVNYDSSRGMVIKTPNKGLYDNNEQVLLEVIAYSDYRFTGWTGDITDTSNIVTFTMNGNKIINANIVPIIYRQLITSSNGHGRVMIPGEPGPFPIAEGSSVPLVARPDYGYMFVNWTGNAGDKITDPASKQTYILMDADYNVCANFEVMDYTLTLSAATGGLVVTPGSGSYPYPYNTPVSITAQVADPSSHEFTGWKTPAGALISTDIAATITISGNMDLVATFAPKQYALTVSSPNGSVDKSPAQPTYAHGTSVILTANPNWGYQFTEWTGDGVPSGSTNSSITVTMDQAKTVTAHYEKRSFALNISGEHGTVSNSPGGNTHSFETPVTLTPMPDTGYEFTHWSGHLTGSANPANMVMDNDKTITAHFAIKTYTLLVASEHGSITKVPAQTRYSHGTQVAVKVIDAVGYDFVSWSGSETGTDNPLTLTMDGDKELTAHFVTDTTAPAAVTLTAQLVGGKIRLQWTPNPADDDIVSYEIYRATTASGPYVDPIASVTALNWEDSPPCDQQNPNLYYVVKASDGVNKSAFSNEVLVPIQFKVHNATQNKWYLTIGEAMSLAQTNDVLRVNPGTYAERITFKDKRLTLIGDINNPATTIIDGQNTGTVVMFAMSSGSSVLKGFTITGGQAAIGGGIYCQSASSIIERCLITGNTAQQGGGLAADYALLTLKGCDFEDNTATIGCGGAMYDVSGQRSEIHLKDCDFEGNQATQQGGAVYGFSGEILMAGFWDNTALQGGAVAHTLAALFSCAITNNHLLAGGQGSGLYDCDGDIVSCTITNNAPSIATGGLVDCLGLIKNSIIWGNGNGASDQLVNYATPSYCCIQNGPTTNDNSNSDPLLGTDGYHLQTGSPCINTGDPYYVFPSGVTDIDGGRRVYPYRTDRGADEFDYNEPCYLDTSAVVPEGRGTITLSPAPPYISGQTVELTATPAPGWRFSAWTGDVPHIDPCNHNVNPNPIISIVMDGNKTVTAHFSDLTGRSTKPTYINNLASEPVGTTITLGEGGGANHCFCVEMNEHLGYNNTGLSYFSSLDTKAYMGGTSGGKPDPIDPRTAYLYTQFRNGTLAGFDGSICSYKSLQRVIWFFEEEIPSLFLDPEDPCTPIMKAFQDQFFADASTCGWTDIGNVRILNITRDPNQVIGDPNYVLMRQSVVIISQTPVAEDDRATTPMNTPVSINVLANDSDPNNKPLSVVSFTQGFNGTVNQNGTHLVYTPNLGYIGPDRFSYTITNSLQRYNDTAEVFISVNMLGQPDVYAGADKYITLPDNQITLSDAWVQARNPQATQTFLWSVESSVFPDLVDFDPITPGIQTSSNALHPVVQLHVPPMLFELAETIPFVLRLEAKEDGVIVGQDSMVVMVGPGVDSDSQQPPQVDAGDYSPITVLDSLLLAGTAEDDGLPYGELTVLWSFVSCSDPEGMAHIADPTRLDSPVSFTRPGIYGLELTAHDGLAAVTDRTMITVTAGTVANRPLVVDAGSYNPIEPPNDPLTMVLDQATVEDEHPESLSYSWRQIAGPVGGVVFQNGATNVLHPTVTFKAYGVFTFELSADDGQYLAIDQVQITVNEPAMPNLTIDAGADQIISLPSPAQLVGMITIDGISYDQTVPQGIRLLWTQIDGPDWADIKDANSLQTQARLIWRGEYTFQLEAWYGLTYMGADTVHITAAATETYLSGGMDHSLILMDDGHVRAFGLNKGCIDIGGYCLQYEGYLGTGDKYSYPLFNGNNNESEGYFFPQVVARGEMNTPSGFLENIVAISAGWKHSLALDMDGHVWSFGDNRCGELGNSDIPLVGSKVPVPVQAGSQVVIDPNYLENIVAIGRGSCGADHSFAIDKEGYVWTWGRNEFGQLGIGVLGGTQGYFGKYKPLPDSVRAGEQNPGHPNDPCYPLSNIVAATGGIQHSMALERLDITGQDPNCRGRVYTWGNNRAQYEADPNAGILGNDDMLGYYTTTPVLVHAGDQGRDPEYLIDIVAVAAGLEHCVALEKLDPNGQNSDWQGRVYTWGCNGNGWRMTVAEMWQLTEPGTYGSTLGDDGFGRLGNGYGDQPSDPNVFSSPQVVWAGKQLDPNLPGYDPCTPLRNIVAIAAGECFTMALERLDPTGQDPCSQGRVYTWGSNFSGALGNGDQNPDHHHSTPVMVASPCPGNPDYPPYLKNVVAIAAGSWHCLALDSDGNIWAWGDYSDGRLGIGELSMYGYGKKKRSYNSRKPIYRPQLVYSEQSVINETKGKSYPTITDALNSSYTEAGDVIVISPGSYFENIPPQIQKGVTLQSVDPDNWEMVQNTVIVNGLAFDSRNGSSGASVLKGLTISGGYYGVFSYYIPLRVEHCIIEGFSQTGISINTPTQYPIEAFIEDCKINYKGGGTQGYCAGIDIGGSVNADITNTLIYSDSVTPLGTIGIYCRSGNETIRNNTIVRMKDGIVKPTWVKTLPVITNCIIWGANDSLVGCDAATYCCLDKLQNEPNAIKLNPTNIGLDPGFLNENDPEPENRDYHLRADSPCLNKGLYVIGMEAEVDIDGDPRIMGTAVDMGADERGWLVASAGTYPSIVLSPAGTADIVLNQASLNGGTPQWVQHDSLPPVAFAPSSQTLQPTVTFSSAGRYTLRLEGRDVSRLQAWSDATIDVRLFVNAGSDSAVELLPTANTTTLLGTVGQGTSCLPWWTIVSGPSGGVHLETPAQLTCNAAFYFAGEYVLKLTAYSPSGAVIGEDTVTITVVEPANTPPLVEAGDHQVVYLDNGQVEVDLGDVMDRSGGAWIWDRETPSLPYFWSTDMPLPGPVTFRQDNGHVYAGFTQAGYYTLRLNTYDSDYERSDTVSIAVYPDSELSPFVTIGKCKHLLGAGESIIFNQATLLPESMTPQWSCEPDTAVFDNPQSLRPQVTFPQMGIYAVTLQGWNGPTLMGQDTAYIMVLSENRQTLIEAGADKTATFPVSEGIALEDAYILSTTLSSYSQQWSVYEGDTSAVRFHPSCYDVNPVVFFTKPGTYTLELTVYDSDTNPSDRVHIVVTGGISGDTVGPELNLTAQAGGDQIVVQATAHDDSGIVESQLRLTDGSGSRILKTLSGEPAYPMDMAYEVALAASYFEQNSTLVMTAIDRAGNPSSLSLGYDNSASTVWHFRVTPDIATPTASLLQFTAHLNGIGPAWQIQIVDSANTLKTTMTGSGQDLPDGDDPGSLAVSGWQDGSYTAKLVVGGTVRGAVSFKVMMQAMVLPTAVLTRLGNVALDGEPNEIADLQSGNIDGNPLPRITLGRGDLYGTASHTIFAGEVYYRIDIYNREIKNYTDSLAQWQQNADLLIKNITPWSPQLENGWCHGHIENGSLGTLDLTGIDNGVYQLLLTVKCLGVETYDHCEFVLDTPLKIGNVKFSQEDMAFTIGGVPLRVVRTYDSFRRTAPGDFGFGWTYSLANMDITLNETREGSEGYTIRYGSDFNRDVTLTMPDGQRATFISQLTPKLGNGWSHGEWTVEYQSPVGIHATLKTAKNDTLVYGGSIGGVGYFWKDDEGDFLPTASGMQIDLSLHDISSWVLTLEDGTQCNLERQSYGQHYINLADGTNYPYQSFGRPYLSSIVLPTGEQMLCTVDTSQGENPVVMGICSNRDLNKRITIVRDDNGRIKEICAPGDGNGPPSLKYDYDRDGNLTMVYRLKDAATGEYETTSYRYDNNAYNPPDHFVTDIIDSRGIMPIQYVYDSQGRLTETIDGKGNHIILNHDGIHENDRYEEVVSRSGAKTRYFYNERGNVKMEQKLDPYDVILQSIDYAYGNSVFPDKPTLMSQTVPDPNHPETATLSAVTAYTYGATTDGKLTYQKVIDPEDNTTETWFDDNGNVTVVKQGRINAVGQIVEVSTTRNAYDDYGRLIQMGITTGSENNWHSQTRNGYDTQGRLETVTQMDVGYLADPCDPHHIITKYWYDQTPTHTLSGSADQPYSVSEPYHQGQSPVYTRYSHYNANNQQDASWYFWDDPANGVGNDKRVLTINDLDAQGRVVRTWRKVDTNTNPSAPNLSGILTTGPVEGDVILSNTVYNSLGKVEYSIDENNNLTAYSYDELGNGVETRTYNVASVDRSTPTVVRTYIAYDSNRLTVSRTFYDDEGRAVAAVGPYDPYDTAHPPVGTETVYDELGRVKATRRWAAMAIELEPCPGGMRAKRWTTEGHLPVENAELSYTRTEYDIAGRVKFSITLDKDGTNEVERPTMYLYDRAGKQTDVIDALGLTPNGDTWTINYANGHRTRTVYEGNQRKYQYEPGAYQGNNSGAHDFVEGGVTFSYTDRMEFTYDSLSRLVCTRYPAADVAEGNGVPTYSHVGYDGLGRKAWESEVTIKATAAALDHDTETRHYEYDAAGRLTTVILPKVYDPQTSGDAHPQYDYYYDPHGNLAGILDAQDRLVVLKYNEHHQQTHRYLPFVVNPATLSDAASVYATLATQAPPGLKYEYRTYNSLGQLLTVTDYAGQVTAYLYTPQGQLSDQRHYQAGHYPAGPVVSEIHMTYDNRGRKDIVTFDEDIWDYDYDTQGRVEKITSPQGVLVYDYDPVTGRPKTLRTPGDGSDTELEYRYDALGRISDVVVHRRNGQSVTEDTTYGYTDAGLLDWVCLPNGDCGDYDYDPLGRLMGLSHENAGNQQLYRYAYQYYANGQKRRAREYNAADTQVKEIVWTYDRLNRLTQESYDDRTAANADFTDAYSFDRVGNRWSRTHNGAATYYQYNAFDQLLAESPNANYSNPTVTYGYDDNGSLTLRTPTGGNQTGYAYDSQGKLARVFLTNGTPANPADDTALADYWYDPQGIRVARQAGAAQPVNYLINPFNPTGYPQVFKEKQSGAADQVYLIGMDVLGRASGANSPVYYMYDGHGSVAHQTNASGAVTADYNYDAYGNALGFTPTDGLYYSGEMWDSVAQMQYLRARYYHPTTGRFSQTDPFEGYLEDPLSLHRYLYCYGNPINGIDPSGQEFSITGLVANVSVRVMMFTIQHPYLAGAIGLAVNVVMPADWQEAMIGSGIPPFQLAGNTGRLGKGFLRTIYASKNPAFKRIIDRWNKSASGRLAQVTGEEFQKFFKRYLPNARENVSVGNGLNTVDFQTPGYLIEIKSGISSFNKEQLSAISQAAKESGDTIVYIFLEEPTAGTQKKILDAGGNIIFLYERH